MAAARLDTWWQTETGGISSRRYPARHPPSRVQPRSLGIKPVIVDPATGAVMEGNNVSGALCLGTPWPGQARTVFGDHQRFRETYFTQYPGYYFTGDGARRDEDGYYWITGRIDDVMNVSGHRLGTAEVESALVAHESVAEAAVVGYPHPLKGQGIYCYVLLNSGFGKEDPEQLIGALKEQVRQAIGAFAAPDVIHIAAGLPKTRSGKIMRRILRKIAASDYEGLGDTSTLAEPEVVKSSSRSTAPPRADGIQRTRYDKERPRGRSLEIPRESRGSEGDLDRPPAFRPCSPVCAQGFQEVLERLM